MFLGEGVLRKVTVTWAVKERRIPSDIQMRPLSETNLADDTMSASRRYDKARKGTAIRTSSFFENSDAAECLVPAIGDQSSYLFLTIVIQPEMRTCKLKEHDAE